MKVIIKGLKATKDMLAKQANDIQETQFNREVDAMVEDLVASTPVDTGEARSGWHKANTRKSGSNTLKNLDTIVENDVPHINLLNKGSSQQAPAFFVESVAIRHGIPVGVIATEK